MCKHQAEAVSSDLLAFRSIRGSSVTLCGRHRRRRSEVLLKDDRAALVAHALFVERHRDRAVGVSGQPGDSGARSRPQVSAAPSSAAPAPWRHQRRSTTRASTASWVQPCSRVSWTAALGSGGSVRAASRRRCGRTRRPMSRYSRGAARADRRTRRPSRRPGAAGSARDQGLRSRRPRSATRPRSPRRRRGEQAGRAGSSDVTLSNSVPQPRDGSMARIGTRTRMPCAAGAIATQAIPGAPNSPSRTIAHINAGSGHDAPIRL